MNDIIEWVRSGKCIVYPTSTLPALGCIPETSALDALFEIKGRPRSAPVSLGVANLSQASKIVEVTDDVYEILEEFPDGSLTIVLSPINEMDYRLGSRGVAVRVVSDPRARELLLRTGPLTATSANQTGEDPLLDCIAAADSLCTSEHTVLGIDGECHGGLPSTLIAWHTVCSTPESLKIEVVREGKISSEEVLAWWKRRT
ncbi:MAG: L-threonylcarbamoyladenylate synthase [Candidatus Thalassarchaeaceae archaeon]